MVVVVVVVVVPEVVLVGVVLGRGGTGSLDFTPEATGRVGAWAGRARGCTRGGALGRGRDGGLAAAGWEVRSAGRGWEGNNGWGGGRWGVCLAAKLAADLSALGEGIVVVVRSC